MTLPNEEARALMEGLRLLEDLNQCQSDVELIETCRRVRGVLRHYPMKSGMERIAAFIEQVGGVHHVPTEIACQSYREWNKKWEYLKSSPTACSNCGKPENEHQK